uniref:Uncharacterized protein n=1 Tax=Clytia hemisphaerica TaxID=252671 RepID=A0A7M5WT18_9CNID|eukprot:TCONS_00069817-protein
MIGATQSTILTRSFNLRMILITSILTIGLFTEISVAKPTTINTDEDLTTALYQTDIGRQMIRRRQRRSIEACYAECKTSEKICYDNVENDSFQETLVCMQATDGCKNDCDALAGKRRRKRFVDALKSLHSHHLTLDSEMQ